MMAKAAAVADEQQTGMQRWKEQPEKLGAFLTDVRSEMRKVIWPSREEVQANTITVIVTCFIFAFFFLAVDSVLGRTIEFVLNKLTH